jgi:hypothetical protein
LFHFPNKTRKSSRSCFRRGNIRVRYAQNPVRLESVMPSFTPEQLLAVQAMQHRVQARLAGDAALRQQVNFIGTYLVESEAQLIALMNTTPPPAGGSVEFGMVLYWIHHDLPNDSFFDWFASLFPPTQITPTQYAQWQTIWAGAGVIAPDGTMVADGPFSQLDKGWLYSSVLYTLGILGELQKAPFGSTPQVIALPNNPTLTVALIGDWGTGPWSDCSTDGPATAIMNQLQTLSPPPDIIIHVGDVYYSGTGHLPWEITLLMAALYAKTQVTFFPTEENLRLIQRWWSKPPVPPSFTLNSNHEMYSGANGYFYDALGSPLFAAQKGTSYFALYYQDWAILGLDSGFYSTSFFNMQGALQDSADPDQVAWFQGLDLSPKNIIALTHHTALSVEGFPIENQLLPDLSEKLYQDMYSALNSRDPDYWYWGHTHNGVVYNSNATMSSSRKTKTLCRCVGHSAIPFGTAYYWDGQNQLPLTRNGKVDYYACTPLPNPNQCKQWDKRVKNGFAVLTLQAGTISEAFYEQDNPVPVWTSGPVKLPAKGKNK